MLSYKTIGNRDGEPLVFLHGLGAGSEQTTAAFPSLDSTYLVAPDMPGHGESLSYNPAQMSFNYFADLTVQLIKHLGLQSVNLGGLSMGSGISLNIALRYPEIVNKLILLRPSWLDQKRPEHLKLVALVGQWIEDSGISEAKKKLDQHSEFSKLAIANPPVAASITALFQRSETPASTSVLYKMWQDSPFEDLDSLERITQPALVLTTARDELHPQSVADQISARLPNSQTASLPPRYHHKEAYAETLQSEVSRFLVG